MNEADTSPDRASDPGEGVGASIAATTRPTAIVAPQPASSEDPADRWLVGLRFVAVAGMAATILAADKLVEGLDVTGMMTVLLVIGASNVVWLTMLSWPRVRAQRPDPERPAGRRYVELQLAVDVISLAAMLWFAGGVTNPFTVFLTFQIALAGLLCTPRATLGITGLTLLAAAILTLAPPLPPLPAGLERVATAAAVSSLAALLGAFVAVYAARLSQLRAESDRNERLAVLGRLVGSMSHELNTPLATILLISRDLARFRGEMSAEEVEEAVLGIVREAERANDIVGLVRGHVGPDQATEPVELCAFVEDLARAELDRLGFSGERRFDLESPLLVPIMKRAFVQVVANLLRNAAEASLIGRTKRITVSVKRRDAGVAVAIEDRGPGFSPDVLARLGEPFQTTKEAQGGMGLGLYVSALLAKQMGATLTAEALRGGGARVVLLLGHDKSEHGTSDEPKA